ncbi:amidohydrolase family protein [Sporosarcina sp. Te-1]|uniref:amidohydrolase family protein n=1 Tax=Sporosarcina sp. Te-1 TaxID=2818390 RepID=UPI001A9D2E2F|nr:amidohydrolase family protein [Sporosarcina sp. Te-1]QTD42949.1 amidohydrolase family protein [Sporosarcina sp. Te-1]
MDVPKNFILKNATIIDVENGTSFKGAIEVNHGHIQSVFVEDSDLPQGTETINVEGKYIIPGLIDMHCHIREDFAGHFVASGVTTVRNTAGNVFQLKKLIESPIDAPTPRVYSADRMIDGPPGLWGPTSYGNFVTDDPVEGRREVQRQKDAGAQFIKVYGWISKEVMEAVVSEADKLGLEVSCDLIHSSQINALDAAKLGVKWFEHASGFIQAIYPDWYPLAEQEIWDEIDWERPDKKKIKDLCMHMIQYNVNLCPTLTIFDQIVQMPSYWHPSNAVTETVDREGGLKDLWLTMSKKDMVEAWKKQLGSQIQFIKYIAKIYHELGGTVVTGTDTPGGVWTWPGMALHRELELFVEIGFTEMEAIQAATIKAAKSIHMKDIGVIKEGTIADMVILNQNPLEDIQHTRDIDRIIKGGRMYTQEEILGRIPTKEYLDREQEKFLAEYEKMSV